MSTAVSDRIEAHILRIAFVVIVGSINVASVDDPA
jgi:hypothetical protein